ncbi:hypothetical protein JYT51_01375 [Candidatus Amoebophilus asiaticus]|nr:hypothetical protein [Candidatus Amoebophilus asiaticus]
MRKTLFANIEEFISIECSKQQEIKRIFNYLVVAKYLFTKNLCNKGWQYLLKAERNAITIEDFELLNYIYHIQLENTHLPDALHIIEIDKKKEENIKLIKLEAPRNTFYHVLKYHMKIDTKTDSPGNNVEEEYIDKYLKKNNIDKALNANSQLYCEYVMERVLAMVDKNEFKKLAPFLASKYSNFVNNNVFNRRTHLQKLKFLEILCKTYLRIREFSEAKKYYRQLEEELWRYGKKYYSLIVPYSTMMSDICFCTNRIDDGLEFLNHLSANPPYTLSEKDNVLLSMNLAGLYFGKKEYPNARKAILKIKFCDKNIQKSFGRPILLIKYLSELIIYFENCSKNYIDYKIKSINVIFADLLLTEKFYREKKFLYLIKKLNQRNSICTNTFFRKEIYNFINLKEIEPSTSEVISLNAWLRSKIDNRDYYRVYLEMIS